MIYNDQLDVTTTTINQQSPSALAAEDQNPADKSNKKVFYAETSSCGQHKNVCTIVTETAGETIRQKSK